MVTFGRGGFFALGLIQTLFVVKYPLLTHIKPGVKLHTKVYPTGVRFALIRWLAAARTTCTL